MATAEGAETLAEAIEAAAMPVLRAHGVTLVDLDVRRGGRRSLLRVYIDKPGGVGVDDCSRVSAELGDVLEVADVLAGSYDLEVSSPGLDRELRKERELRWGVGKRVRVFLREPVDGRRELVGRLLGVEDDVLTLDDAVGTRGVPRTAVTKVRLDVGLSGSA